MIRTFDHHFAGIDRVVDGAGSVARVPTPLERLGATRVGVVTNRSLATTTPLVAAMEAALGERHAVTFARMRAHAPAADVDDCVDAMHEAGVDALVGFGGSSVTDATKIVVKLLHDAAGGAALPFVLVPTTLSAGEYTAAAGMTGDVAGVKTYVMDPCMAPYAVVLDPEVSRHTPLELWLSTGMKTVDHACEALWGVRRHPLTDALAVGALERVVPALRTTKRDPDAMQPRAEAELAGFLSMHCVQHSVVYLAHTLGHQIAARWDVEHGITSCITLPVVAAFRAPDEPEGIAVIGRALGVPAEGVPDALRVLVGDLGLPSRLRDVGASRADFAAVADATVTASRQLGFEPPAPETLVELLDQMW